MEYTDAKNIIVKYENGFRVKTSYSHFINLEVKSPYDKTVHGIGFLGEGEFSVKINGKITKQYWIWAAMLQRCYSKKHQIRVPAYIGCTVAPEWHNFQIFGKWFNENYYEIPNQEMNLDKDILFKGNKIYSPNSCVFVPKEINLLFVKRDSMRGDNPIGVSYSSRDKTYCTSCQNGEGRTIHLGSFTNPIDAFYPYKIYKENRIKEFAHSYEKQIPKKLFNAMLEYKVNITD